MRKPTPRVRRAAPDDARRVAELLHDFNTEFGDPTPGPDVLTQHVAQMLAAGEMTVLLGDEPPTGLVMLRFRRSVWTGALDAYVEELYVAPPHRGQGLGRALLERALDVARDAGATRVDVGTSEADTAARALYESCGFTNREGGPDGPTMLFYEREL